jgi:hypothetical protein
MWSEYFWMIAVAEVEHDLGAPGRPVDRLQRVLAAAVGLPADAVADEQSGPPRGQGDPVGHHERRVEAHAELADEGRVPALVAGEGLEELAGAGLGDGADVLHHFRPAHADAVVADGDRARGGIVGHPDLQRAVVLLQLGAREDLETQPVDGVGGVRDQLTQEDLLVAVQRVDHQVQDLDDLGLEAMRFLLRLRAHQTAPPVH